MTSIIKHRACFGVDLFQNNNDLEGSLAKYKALAEAETARADANAEEIVVLRDMLHTMKTGNVDKETEAASQLEGFAAERDMLQANVLQLQQALAAAEVFVHSEEQAKVAAQLAAKAALEASEVKDKEHVENLQRAVAAAATALAAEEAARTAAEKAAAAASDELCEKLRSAEAELTELKQKAETAEQGMAAMAADSMTQRALAAAAAEAKSSQVSDSAANLQDVTAKLATVEAELEKARAEGSAAAAKLAAAEAELEKERSEGSKAAALTVALAAAQSELTEVQSERVAESALRNATNSAADVAAADELCKAQAQLEEAQAQLEEGRKQLEEERSAKAAIEGAAAVAAAAATAAAVAAAAQIATLSAELEAEKGAKAVLEGAKDAAAASAAQLSEKLAAQEAAGVEAESEAKRVAMEEAAKAAAAAAAITAAAAKAAEEAEEARAAKAEAEAKLVKKDTDMALRETGVLRIVVLSASGLRAGDRNGSSDPFAKVSLGAMPEVSHKTSVVAHSLEPKWNEAFDFHGPLGQMATAPLEVHVLDQDAGGLSSTDLGTAQLSLAALAPGGPKQLLSGSLTGANAQGTVEVQASFAIFKEVLAAEVYIKPKGLKATKYDKHLVHVHHAKSDAEGWSAYRASYLDGGEVLHAGTVMGMADVAQSRSIVTLEHGAWSVRFLDSKLYFQWKELLEAVVPPPLHTSHSANDGTSPRGGGGLFGRKRSSPKLPVH